VYEFVEGTDYTGPMTAGEIEVRVAPQVLIDGEATSCGAGASINLRNYSP
jgi:hypothetical protein